MQLIVRPRINELSVFVQKLDYLASAFPQACGPIEVEMPFTLQKIPVVSVVDDALIVANLAENVGLAASIRAEPGWD